MECYQHPKPLLKIAVNVRPIQTPKQLCLSAVCNAHIQQESILVPYKYAILTHLTVGRYSFCRKINHLISLYLP
nr:MAG TPA: hypothetical protein [Caudoviricetes sp.]